MKLLSRVAIVIHIVLIFSASDTNSADWDDYGTYHGDLQGSQKEFINEGKSKQGGGGGSDEGMRNLLKDKRMAFFENKNSTASGGREERVLPAVDAALNDQFPYFTSLIVTKGDGSIMRCAGALISDAWVLTAASCIASATNVMVYAGWATQDTYLERAHLNVYSGPTTPLPTGDVKAEFAARTLDTAAATTETTTSTDTSTFNKTEITALLVETITETILDTKTDSITTMKPSTDSTDTTFVPMTDPETDDGVTAVNATNPGTDTEYISLPEKETVTVTVRETGTNYRHHATSTMAGITETVTVKVPTIITATLIGTNTVYVDSSQGHGHHHFHHDHETITVTKTIRYPAATTVVSGPPSMPSGTSSSAGYDHDHVHHDRETVTVTKTIRYPPATTVVSGPPSMPSGTSSSAGQGHETITVTKTIRDPPATTVVSGPPSMPSGTPSSAGIAMAHPGYKKDSLHHNIALVRLTTPFIISGKLSPIRLDRKEHRRHLNGISLTSMGFAQAYSNKLYYTKLEQIRKSNCRSRLTEIYVDHSERTACLSSTRSASGFCHGGLGGPIVHTFQNTPSASLLGIISQSEPCPSAYPLGYTKIGPYLDWIKSHVKRLYYHNN